MSGGLEQCISKGFTIVVLGCLGGGISPVAIALSPAIAQTTPAPTQRAQGSDRPPVPAPEAIPPSTPSTRPETKTTEPRPTQARPATNTDGKPPLDKFPPNPLEVNEPDPLIPYDYKDRPLTAREKQQLIAAADRLVVIGATRLQAGDNVGAFDAWNRELRYRRLAGLLLTEVAALGRVGDVAWAQNNQLQLRYITQRLEQILVLARKAPAEVQRDRTVPPELTTPTKRLELLEALGLAYQQVRLPNVAVSIYDEILAAARNQNDTVKIEATLITLGQLQLGRFNYAEAAKIYAELLERARSRNDSFNIPIYLQQLGHIHEQAKQFAEAIPYHQQLIEFYQTAGDPVPIPALVNKIADNYRRLNQLDKAEQNYQLAYQLAQPQLQFAVAGDALKRLGEMYRANDRLDAAKRIYTFLIQVEQQGYNTYGMMDAYDQLGQVYLQDKDYPEAAFAFQQGLVIAKQLKYKEAYFTAQIEKATEPNGDSETTPPEPTDEGTETPDPAPANPEDSKDTQAAPETTSPPPATDQPRNRRPAPSPR